MEKKPKIMVEDIFLNDDFENIMKNDSPKIIKELLQKLKSKRREK